MLPAASAILIVVLAWNPGGPPAPALASVQRLTTDLAKQPGSADEGARVAMSGDIALLTDAVVDRGRPGVAARDALAYKLLALGYSAKETADVVSERITKRALDTAHAMRLVGRGRDAADYLDSQYHRAPIALAAVNTSASAMPAVPTSLASLARRTTQAARTVSRPAAARPVTVVAPAPVMPTASAGAVSAIDAAILKYARLHAVDPLLIHAVIGAESAYVTRARSSAGAIGLMQLMPDTARALGVNPHIAEENIEGGVRYLAELLRMFGGVELALVAYNAGPGLARRYARGESILYGETRQYVQQVLARLRAPR